METPYFEQHERGFEDDCSDSGGCLAQIFAKIPEGGYIVFLLTRFFENCLGGSYVILPSPYYPVCIYEVVLLSTACLG